VVLFISPDISEELRDVVFRSTKSFFAGVILWSFSTFAPEPIFLIVDTLFKELRGIIEEINKRVDDAEASIMSQIPESMKKCYDIQFRRIPSDIIPQLDNLEALQAVFNVPEIYCNKAIRDKIEQLTFIPPVRLLLELLNVPTLKEDFNKKCSGIVSNDATMEDSILNAMKPIVTKKQECDM
jgi:hypothetical protein